MNSTLWPPDAGDGTGDTAMREPITTSHAADIIHPPLGKYKRTPSIPIDMLEQNRSSPSVIELDILRRKRQQETQMEMLHYRDMFSKEPLPRDTNADSQYANRTGPVLRFQQSPPGLHSFSRKILKSGLILPMRRNMLSPPKILVGRAANRPDERLSEMMMTMSPDSDDFLLRFPMNAEDKANFFIELDNDDNDNYTDEMDSQPRVLEESQDDLFIPSSSTGLECLREDVLRSRSTSPPVRDNLNTKSKISLKPKLRNMMNGSSHASREDLLVSSRRRGSPPNLSALNLSHDIPIKPRVRHPQNFSEASSNSLLNALNIESSSKDIAKPTYFLNEASPFRFVVDKNGLQLNSNEGLSIFSSFAPPPPSDKTPSHQNTPFYSYESASGVSNTYKALVGAETTWTCDKKKSSTENRDLCEQYHGVAAWTLGPENISASDVTPATRRTGKRGTYLDGSSFSKPLSENDKTPM
jgi:hypothetical protein